MRNDNYIKLFTEIKQKIKEAQLKTVVAANSQMLLLYWQLGNYIIANQQAKGWGAKIIDKLSADLKKEFPQLKGFSSRNLKYMKHFATAYDINVLGRFIENEKSLKGDTSITQPLARRLFDVDNDSFTIVQQPAAQLKKSKKPSLVQQPVAQLQDAIFLESIVSKISWSHHLILIDKEPSTGKRLWYMLNTLEHGNSRNVLSIQIEAGLFERQIKAKKVNNFTRTLPAPETDFANYILKDPYIFDFVQATEKANERNIEEQLTNHITMFLLELGQGFAFIGKQVHFKIGGDDFYVDLIFYHARLHAYVAVELKARPFEPGDTSQLNFYINVVNDKMKTKADNNTIGLLLCKGKNNSVAEYALKGYNNAIGISDYQFSKALPDELKSSLPQIEDLERELNKQEDKL